MAAALPTNLLYFGNNEGNVGPRTEAEECKIAFNPRYVQRALNVLNASAVLEVTSPRRTGPPTGEVLR